MASPADMAQIKAIVTAIDTAHQCHRQNLDAPLRRSCQVPDLL
jgi:hypothetical protein